MNLEYVKERFKEFIPIVICILWLIVLMVIYNGINNNTLKALSVKRSEIAQLENQLALAKNRTDTKTTEFAIKNTGVDENRQHRDEGIISDFLTKVGTWNSYESYMAARDSIMSEYGLTEDSDFMKSFMPKINNRTDDAGNNYNKIDTFGLNVKFTDNVTYLLSIADDYAYLSEAYMESKDDEGGEGRTRMVLLFNITKDGKISSVYGTSVAG